MPKVSVIVPVYNVEMYIAKCLDSLLNQTLEDIEIILVNDGSRDGSIKIINEYMKKNNKIILLEKENGGLSSARNYGIPYATGEYIAFLDSDDYIEKKMYETMYKKAKSKDYDMVECNFYWEYPNNKLKKDIGEKYKNKKEALEKARVVAWNKLYKRELIQNSRVRFPEGLRYEDVEFFYNILPSLNKIGFVEEPFVHYIQRSNSISNTQNEKTSEIFIVLDNVLNFYKKNNLWEEYKEELEYTYTRYLLCSSLKRMIRIPDDKIRKKLLSLTWENLNNTFPKWKKNSLLHKKSKKNLYMLSVNNITFKLYCTILRIFIAT